MSALTSLRGFYTNTMNDFFTLAIDEGIAHLQLNRPERLNTMAPPFFPALRDAVRGLHDSEPVNELGVPEQRAETRLI